MESLRLSIVEQKESVTKVIIPETLSLESATLVVQCFKENVVIVTTSQFKHDYFKKYYPEHKISLVKTLPKRGVCEVCMYIQNNKLIILVRDSTCEPLLNSMTSDLFIGTDSKAYKRRLQHLYHNNIIFLYDLPKVTAPTLTV